MAHSVLGRARGAYGRFLLDRGERDRAIALLKDAVESQGHCLGENKESPRDKKALEEHRACLVRAGLAP